MSDDTYTCSVCKQTFGKARTDEEAMAESAAIFGATDPKDLGVVCDDCWRTMMGLPPSDDEIAEAAERADLP